MNPTVDQYVSTKITPQHQQIVARLRALMREYAPNAQEAVGYGMLVWKTPRVFAFITATEKAVTFGFTRGIQIEDRFRLLKGTGKTTRHVKLKSLSALNENEEALRDYIKQAVELDAQ